VTGAASGDDSELHALLLESQAITQQWLTVLNMGCHCIYQEERLRPHTQHPPY
jgi:hypothetical protein